MRVLMYLAVFVLFSNIGHSQNYQRKYLSEKISSLSDSLESGVILDKSILLDSRLEIFEMTLLSIDAVQHRYADSLMDVLWGKRDTCYDRSIIVNEEIVYDMDTLNFVRGYCKELNDSVAIALKYYSHVAVWGESKDIREIAKTRTAILSHNHLGKYATVNLGGIKRAVECPSCYLRSLEELKYYTEECQTLLKETSNFNVLKVKYVSYDRLKSFNWYDEHREVNILDESPEAKRAYIATCLQFVDSLMLKGDYSQGIEYFKSKLISKYGVKNDSLGFVYGHLLELNGSLGEAMSIYADILKYGAYEYDLFNKAQTRLAIVSVKLDQGHDVIRLGIGTNRLSKRVVRDYVIYIRDMPESFRFYSEAKYVTGMHFLSIGAVSFAIEDFEAGESQQCEFGFDVKCHEQLKIITKENSK